MSTFDSGTRSSVHFTPNIEGVHKTNNSWIVNDIRCKIINLKSTELLMLKFIIAARSSRTMEVPSYMEQTLNQSINHPVNIH